jgi:uncharacterized membrane protein YkoI
MNTFKFKGFPLTTLGLTLCLAITMGASGPAATAKSKKSEETSSAQPVSLTKQTKVNMSQAEDIALKEVPGRVKRIELETDDDVLLYEIIICQGRVKKEVRVDAVSGKILEVDKKLIKCD